jgi:cyclopropane fatty-acyl-phospholipid synthase-like methyltransferase
MSRSHFKGKYIPKNVNKYTGNAKQIIYRSSWERLFMVYCDKKQEIKNWSSEEIKIPYMFEGKHRTYYPDFWVDMMDKDGMRVQKIVEIKPHYQRTMKVNKAKWSAATKYAQDNHMEFLVMTEKELF